LKRYLLISALTAALATATAAPIAASAAPAPKMHRTPISKVHPLPKMATPNGTSWAAKR
jgi:hypothetical protein